MNTTDKRHYECEDIIENRVVVSDIASYTCGSAPCSVASEDGTRIYAAYLASRTGRGECHDIVVMADIPVAEPQRASSHLIVEKGTEVAGVFIEDIIHTAAFSWNGKVRVVLSLNDAVLAWRDWDPATKSVSGEGLFRCAFDGTVQTMTPEATTAFLTARNFTGFNVFREIHDRVLASVKFNAADGCLYGFVTSSFSQPVLFRSADGETLQFLGAVPSVCQYECQVACMDNLIFALGRGMQGANFFVSEDGGLSFRPLGRVADGLCRQQLLVYDGHLFLGFPAPDELPTGVRNGRNNFHLMVGRGVDFSDYVEIAHVLDPRGLIMFEFVQAGDDVYCLWSNAERFPDYVKWGAVQGKDQVLFAKMLSGVR